MLYSWFLGLNPVVQAGLATCFTWFVTALGAAMVFFFKVIDKKILNTMLGFAAGVMIAASFWSLLNPAIELSESMGYCSWLTAGIGFLLGGLFLLVVDRILPNLSTGLANVESEEQRTSWQRSMLLIVAITLHNIPEGLAVGVAFGALGANLSSATIAGAIGLALGIGIQNFPEGAAVSIPLRREGVSRWKSFYYGQLSAVVEPIAGVLGAFAVMQVRPLLPYALAFAAGAMIYVVVKELVPESQRDSNTDWATMGAMLGFVVMMILDVSLG